MFFYLAINVALVSALSVKMKDVANINNIKYWNTVLLVISIALFTSFTTFMVTVDNLVADSAVETVRESRVHLYSGIVMIIFAIAMIVVMSMMIASSEYSNVPQDIKGWIIATLVVNVVLIVLGIAYIAYDKRQSVSQWFQSIRNRIPTTL